MKTTHLPLYDCVYHVNLPELMKNPVYWREIEQLPICKQENTGEIITNEQLPNKTIMTIRCPKVHVREITTHRALFDKEHPCTVLEYRGPVVENSRTKKWVFRVFPGGGIDMNDQKLTMKQLEDITHQIEMQRSRFYPQNTKRK